MSNEEILSEVIMQTMAIYAETRQRTVDETAAAERELRCYLPLLIKQSDAGHHMHLIAKGLRHLRELEGRPAPARKGMWIADRVPGMVPYRCGATMGQ
jgi:hypothetical protein